MRKFIFILSLILVSCQATPRTMKEYEVVYQSGEKETITSERCSMSHSACVHCYTGCELTSKVCGVRSLTVIRTYPIEPTK